MLKVVFQRQVVGGIRLAGAGLLVVAFYQGFRNVLVTTLVIEVQYCGGDDVAVGENGGPFDGIFQLPHVTWPPAPFQGLHGFWAEAELWPAEFLRLPLKEPAGQAENV